MVYYFLGYNQLLIKPSGGDQTDCLSLKLMQLMQLVLLNNYDERSPLWCTCTDHILIMCQAHWSLPSWLSHAPWNNQSPSHDLLLFWTKPRLTCQSGTHTQTPHGYLKTVCFNQDESYFKLRQWAPVPRLTIICTKWLQGWMVSSNSTGTTLWLCLDMLVIRLDLYKQGVPLKK